MKLFTIGFTQRSAEDFFTRLKKAGVRRVVDVRLNNTSQIAGFAKSRDLAYFLKAIDGIDYAHEVAFAPTQEMLDAYKKQKGDWDQYELEFKKLLARRDTEVSQVAIRNGDCLLCSEHEPDQCHRRIVADVLQRKNSSIEIIHL